MNDRCCLNILRSRVIAKLSMLANSWIRAAGENRGIQTAYSTLSLPLVDPEYSGSLRKIDMMKAVNGWESHNVAGFRCS